MANFTNLAKNTVSFVNKQFSAFLGFIKTDDDCFVLLGENEDQRLIWNRPTEYNNLTKN